MWIPSSDMVLSPIALWHVAGKDLLDWQWMTVSKKAQILDDVIVLSTNGESTSAGKLIG